MRSDKSNGCMEKPTTGLLEVYAFPLQKDMYYLKGLE